MANKLLTLRQAAEELGCTAGWLRTLVANGVLKTQKRQALNRMGYDHYVTSAEVARQRRRMDKATEAQKRRRVGCRAT